MTKRTSKNLDAAWRGFGDVLRAASEQAHEEAGARAIRQAMLAADKVAEPDAYRLAFVNAFARYYRERYTEGLIFHLPC